MKTKESRVSSETQKPKARTQANACHKAILGWTVRKQTRDKRLGKFRLRTMQTKSMKDLTVPRTWDA